MEVDIHLKPDAKFIQQKSRAIPIHLQPAVGNEIEKLKKNSHIQSSTNINENCFVSSAVNTVKKEKKLLKHSKFVENKQKNREEKAKMPNME